MAHGVQQATPRRAEAVDDSARVDEDAVGQDRRGGRAARSFRSTDSDRPADPDRPRTRSGCGDRRRRSSSSASRSPGWRAARRRPGSGPSPPAGRSAATRVTEPDQPGGGARQVPTPHAADRLGLDEVVEVDLAQVDLRRHRHRQPVRPTAVGHVEPPQRVIEIRVDVVGMERQGVLRAQPTNPPPGGGLAGQALVVPVLRRRAPRQADPPRRTPGSTHPAPPWPWPTRSADRGSSLLARKCGRGTAGEPGQQCEDQRSRHQRRSDATCGADAHNHRPAFKASRSLCTLGAADDKT